MQLPSSRMAAGVTLGAIIALEAYEANQYAPRLAAAFQGAKALARSTGFPLVVVCDAGCPETATYGAGGTHVVTLPPDGAALDLRGGAGVQGASVVFSAATLETRTDAPAVWAAMVALAGDPARVIAIGWDPWVEAYFPQIKYSMGPSGPRKITTGQRAGAVALAGALAALVVFGGKEGVTLTRTQITSTTTKALAPGRKAVVNAKKGLY